MAIITPTISVLTTNCSLFQRGASIWAERPTPSALVDAAAKVSGVSFTMIVNIFIKQLNVIRCWQASQTLSLKSVIINYLALET